MNNQRLVNSIERKYTPLYKGLIIIFCFILVFISTAFAQKYSPSAFKEVLHHVFHTGAFHHSFFSLFEIIFLLILVLLMTKFNINFNDGSNIAKRLLIFAIICYTLRMLNPNSDTRNPILGMPLLSNINEYSFLFFLYIVLFCKRLQFTFFIKILFKYIFIFSFINALSILISWFFFNIGYIRYANVNITLWESDTLYLFSFMQAISLGLYLIKKKNIYLLSTVLFLLVGFFSQQRGPFYPGFVASAFSLLIYFKIRKKTIKLIVLSFLLIPFLLLLSTNINMTNSNSKFGLTIERYLSVIPGYQSFINEGQLSDSGHWEQSELTTLSILADFPFWGIGYGNSKKEDLYGQSTNIHNAYASVWYYHGIFTLLFYLYILFIILSKLIFTLKNLNKHNYNLFFLKIIILFYLLVYFFAAYFTPEGNLTKIVGQMLWLFPLAFILRTDHESYLLVFEQNNFNIEKIK